MSDNETVSVGVQSLLRARGGDRFIPADPAAALADREEIRELAQLYTFAVDDHDLDALATLFTVDAVFDLGGQRAEGWPAIAEQLGGSMRGWQRMLHTPEAHVVELTGPDDAIGLAGGHAELVTRREVFVAAYRYADRYRRQEGRWVFTQRAVRFIYCAPSASYGQIVSSGQRVQFPGAEPEPGLPPEVTL